MRRLLVLFCLVATPVLAQSPIPGGVLVGGGWVPCNHPIALAAGKGCTARTLTVVPASRCVTVVDVTVCDYTAQCTGAAKPDPYRQGVEAARAAACSALWDLEHPQAVSSLPAFTPGEVFEDPYHFRMRVLSLTATTAGDTAVTCETIATAGGYDHSGKVFAFQLRDSMQARKWWAIDEP